MGKTTHGMTDIRPYRIWKYMKRRCNTSTDTAYASYGGRGIRVCDEWNNSFVAFYEWAIANGYEDDLTIDRFPDRDGNYEPSNCRWATPEQQTLNRDCNNYLTFNGETKTATEFARQLGWRPSTINARIRAKWDVERILTTPPKPSSRSKS